MQKFFLFALSWCMVYGINIWFTYFQVQFLFFSESFSYFTSLLCSMWFGLFFSFKYTFKVKLSQRILKKYLIALLSLSAFNYISVQGLTSMISEEFFYIFIFAVTTIIFFLKFFVYDTFVFTSDND